MKTTSFIQLFFFSLILLAAIVAVGQEPEAESKTSKENTISYIGEGHREPVEVEKACFFVPKGIETQLPVAALTTTVRPRTTPFVLVYRDGTVIWIKSYANLVRGESKYENGQRMFGPYYRATIDPRRVQEFLDSLERFGAFDYAGHSERGIYHGMLDLTIYDETRRAMISMLSSIERIESDGTQFATFDGGSISLEGKRRDEVFASQPPEYQRYRTIRATGVEWLLSLPALIEGEPEELGYLPIEHRCDPPPAIIESSTGE